LQSYDVIEDRFGQTKPIKESKQNQIVRLCSGRRINLDDIASCGSCITELEAGRVSSKDAIALDRLADRDAPLNFPDTRCDRLHDERAEILYCGTPGETPLGRPVGVQKRPPPATS
jgi:hypothetical protein